jgi:hypothetical protein
MEQGYEIYWVNRIDNHHNQVAVYNYPSLNEVCHCAINDYGRKHFTKNFLVGYWKIKVLK